MAMSDDIHQDGVVRLHSDRHSVGHGRSTVQQTRSGQRADEKADAIRVANAVLGRSSLDPDGDLCILARQLLRALERLGEYAPTDGLNDS